MPADKACFYTKPPCISRRLHIIAECMQPAQPPLQFSASGARTEHIVLGGWLPWRFRSSAEERFARSAIAAALLTLDSQGQVSRLNRLSVPHLLYLLTLLFAAFGFSQSTFAAAPTISSVAATNITSTSAQLNGSVNPNGASTTAYFQYGPSTSYGSTTSSVTLNGTTPQNISSTWSGLAPNTTYHFRVVAISTDGISTGNDAAFTTSATAPTNYSVTVSAAPGAGGSVSGAGSYLANSSVTVTATPASGYVFTGWTASGLTVSTSPSYTFTIGGNVSLVANFTQQATYSITTSSAPAAGGSTAGGGNKIAGSTVSLFASAATGYSFTNWTEGGSVVSTNSNYSFTATANRNLVANFANTPTTYTVALSLSPSNGGTVSGAGNYSAGSSVTVTATPASGYTFTGWSANGLAVATSTSYNFNIGGNIALVANFTSSVNPPGNFTLSNDVAYWDWKSPAGPAVNLHWSASSNADSYDVYRNGGLYAGGLKQTSFLNNINLIADQTYTYHIVARNSGGTRTSNTITVLMPGASPMLSGHKSLKMS